MSRHRILDLFQKSCLHSFVLQLVASLRLHACECLPLYLTITSASSVCRKPLHCIAYHKVLHPWISKIIWMTLGYFCGLVLAPSEGGCGGGREGGETAQTEMMREQRYKKRWALWARSCYFFPQLCSFLGCLCAQLSIHAFFCCAHCIPFCYFSCFFACLWESFHHIQIVFIRFTERCNNVQIDQICLCFFFSLPVLVVPVLLIQN